MTSRVRFATILIALTFFGCKGPVETSAASRGEVATSTLGTSAAPGAPSTTSGSATRVEYIKDETLNNMNAIPVTIPAYWHFQGVLFQGGNCQANPYSVWRATSPDGLSFAEALPAMGWAWGTGPMEQFYSKNHCLPLKGAMTAQQFLKYLAPTMQLEYVSDVPVPEAENAQAHKNLQKLMDLEKNPPKQTVDLARASVRSRNGTFVMNGLMKVSLKCTETLWPGTTSVSAYSPGNPPHVVTGPASTMHTCEARTAFLTAPESQFEGVEKQWEKPGMGSGMGTEAWQNAWTQRVIARVQAISAADNQRAAMQRQAQQAQFDHSMAVQQHMHEQFMATMQRGTDLSMQRTEDAMNARSTAASDWVDYSLDRQTVLDPNTGQVSKVSSSYSHTWVDGTGKVSYQTNDPIANPNGVLPVVWTQQSKVHGNGSQ